ncbi:E3 ubiquitin-protein ligase TM129 [Hypsibius exemplaris]|uniref:E3 ubiquitin-protein ligase TM129 n=1 Tax=Hypsibius exemplaris TaxID=2072580 RepID=A0A1W0X0X0_HYPEX|nr:E3 ubiquitin-protein ligase TM129 [Hypsibius exemplaris]
MDYPFLLFTFGFVCLSLMFGIFPPQEFWSSGLTLENALSRWLGSEEDSFVMYNIRRVSSTLLFVACLPFLYVFLAEHWYPEVSDAIKAWEYGSALLVSVFIATLSLAIAAGTAMWLSAASPDALGWSNSTTAVLLGKFACHLQLRSWWDVANQIDSEYKEIDKFTSILSGWNARTIVTRSWIIRVGLYRVDFARQDLCQLEVVRADSHSVSLQGDVTGAQFVTIKVHTDVEGVPDFCLRLNSREFDSFRGYVLAPIHVPDGVVLIKSVIEQFVIAFREQVSSNEPLSPEDFPDPPDNCAGCSLVPADVVLRKYCEGSNCVSCRCRPAWCTTCMGLWFAHQQDQQRPESWMRGTAPCPNCRSVFCVRDVCPVGESEWETIPVPDN